MAIRSHRALNAPQTQITRTRTAAMVAALRLKLAARLASLGCLAVVLGSSGGCSILGNASKAMMRHDKLDEFMVDYRNRALAAKAWHCNKERYCNRGHLDEFQDGFYAGYANVACGGTGCTPAIVPKDYWGWKYQSADGQSGVNAWYEGYPAGVQAAEQDGIGHWTQIRPAGLPMATTPGPMPGTVSAEPATESLPYLGTPSVSTSSTGKVVPSGPIQLQSGPQILMAPAQGSSSASAATAPGLMSGDTAMTGDAMDLLLGAPVDVRPVSAVTDSAPASTAASHELPFSFK